MSVPAEVHFESLAFLRLRLQFDVTCFTDNAAILSVHFFVVFYL